MHEIELDFSRQYFVAILAGRVFRETIAIVVNNSYYWIRCILNFVSAVLSIKSMSYNN